jgi:hypothetical protein
LVSPLESAEVTGRGEGAAEEPMASVRTK